MLPCPIVVLSGKDEFKIFQRHMYFSSDRAAAGLQSDSLTALVSAFNQDCTRETTGGQFRSIEL